MTNAIEQFNQQGLMQQAEMLAKSGIVPKAFRGKPADVLAACLWGAEIGLGPMASMGYIDVIDGNPTLNTEGRMALVRRAGHSVIIEATDTVATVTGKRRDTGDTQTVSFTIDMAKRAGLASKQVWKSYPEAMLTSRALSQLCRNLFPDVLMGMSYAPEEAASFAAPELLDASPQELANRTTGALPPVLEVAGSSPAPVGAAGDAESVTRSGTDHSQAQVRIPPVPIDGNGEILDITTTATSRSFPPPATTVTEAAQRMMQVNRDNAPAADNVDAEVVKALITRIGKLGSLKELFTNQAAAASLSVPRSTRAPMTADHVAKLEAIIDGLEPTTPTQTEEEPW